MVGKGCDMSNAGIAGIAGSSLLNSNIQIETALRLVRFVTRNTRNPRGRVKSPLRLSCGTYLGLT